MTDSEKKELRGIIMQQMEKLKEDISKMKEMTKPISPDNAIGRLSRMEAINEKSVNEASLRNSQSRLELLELTLKRLEDEDFGYCQECDEPIPFKRMSILPESQLCVSCLNQHNE